MAVYTLPQPVLFHHCDPAGIVFYPRYFEMANAAMEGFFADRLNISFADLHGPMGNAVPTVALSVTFTAPSRHGDQLSITIRPQSVGRSSLRVETRALCGAEARFEMNSTLVFTTKDTGRAAPWTDPLRQALEAEIKAQNPEAPA